MADEPDKQSKLSSVQRAARSGFVTFKGWHTNDRLWREIYARSVATLLAAFIAYLIAVIAAGANPEPLRLILLVLGIVVIWIVVWIIVRTMFRVAVEVLIEPSGKRVLLALLKAALWNLLIGAAFCAAIWLISVYERVPLHDLVGGVFPPPIVWIPAVVAIFVTGMHSYSRALQQIDSHFARSPQEETGEPDDSP